MKSLLFSLVFLLTSTFVLADARQFITELTGQANNVILTAPKEKLIPQLQATLQPAFDMQRMTRGAFGSVWREMNKEQQETAIKNFSVLVFNTYLSKAEPNKPFSLTINSINDQGSRTFVLCTFKYETNILSMEYRLIPVEKTWLIYDILVENVSLIGNYRSQFTNMYKGPNSIPVILASLQTKAESLKHKTNE